MSEYTKDHGTLATAGGVMEPYAAHDYSQTNPSMTAPFNVTNILGSDSLPNMAGYGQQQTTLSPDCDGLASDPRKVSSLNCSSMYSSLGGSLPPLSSAYSQFASSLYSYSQPPSDFGYRPQPAYIDLFGSGHMSDTSVKTEKAAPGSQLSSSLGSSGTAGTVVGDGGTDAAGAPPDGDDSEVDSEADEKESIPEKNESE